MRHRGPWRWEPGAPHMLNAPLESKDGSAVDLNSTVMLLSAGARRHLNPEDAALIAAAPDLLTALLEIACSAGAADGTDVAERLRRIEAIALEAITAAGGAS